MQNNTTKTFKALNEEIENDTKVVGEYLERSQKLYEDLNENDKKAYDEGLKKHNEGKPYDFQQLTKPVQIALQEKLSSDVFKRALLLVGGGNLEVQKENAKKEVVEKKVQLKIHYH